VNANIQITHHRQSRTEAAHDQNVPTEIAIPNTRATTRNTYLRSRTKTRQMLTTKLNYTPHYQSLESGFPPREVGNQLQPRNTHLCLFERTVRKPVEAIRSN
jgi:hypothetical protein